MLWKTLVCCLVLAGTVSAVGWKPWVQYKYGVNIRTLTALPEVAQVYTGSLLKLEVDIKTITETAYLGKITFAQDDTVNAVHLPGGWSAEIPESSIQSQPLSISRKSFYVLMNADGSVNQIHFEPSVKDWEKNITIGFIYQLQITPYAMPIKKQPFVNPPTSKDTWFAVFHTNEKSLFGECDVLYHINPLTPAEAVFKQDSLEEDIENYRVITKSWNFTNCKRMNKFIMGLSDPQNFEAGGNAQLPISRSSQSRAVILGDLKNFTITEVETNSTFSVAPQLYNQQKSMVVTNFKATLLRRTPLSSPPVTPPNLMKDEGFLSVKPQNHQGFMKDPSQDVFGIRSNPYLPKFSTNLADNALSDQGYGSSLEVPLPYNVAWEGSRIGDALGRNISVLIAAMVQNITEQLQNPTQISGPAILSQVIVAVKHMRTMSWEEIDIAHTIVLEKEQETENLLLGKVLRNIAALAGTPHSLQAMFTWLIQDKVPLEEFTQHISLQREVALVPNDIYYLEIWKQITLQVDKLDKPDQQALKRLRTTVALTFTDILRMAGRKHKQLTHSVVDYYISRMEEAIKYNNNEEVQLTIRLLGNIASKRIFKLFHELIIGEKNVSQLVRQHALASLDYVTILHPRSMQKFLFSVFDNTSMPCELRCQAVPGIMRSNPPAWMLQQMAQATNNETSPRVRAQVSSAIRTAAELRGRYNEELARNARAAVNLLKPEEFDASYSAVLFDSYKIDGMDLSYSQLLSFIGSQDSLLPSSVQYSLFKNYNGYRPLEFQASGMVTSANDTLEAIMLALLQTGTSLPTDSMEEPDIMFEVNTAPSKIPTLPFRDIHVQRRSKLEGNINIPRYGFWTFDRQSLQKQIKDIVQKFDGSSRSVEVMKMSNARELMFAVPDGIGSTYVFTYSTMQLTNVSGTVRLQKHIPVLFSSKSSPWTLQVQGNINVTLAMREESKVGFVTPWNSLDYISGVDINTQVNAPVNGAIEFELNQKWDNVKVSAEVTLPQDNTNLIHRSTEPYVTKIWLLENTTTTAGNPNTILLHNKPPVMINYSMGKDLTGMAARVEYYSEIENIYTNQLGDQLQQIEDKSWWSAVYRWIYHQYQGYNAFSVLHFPFASRDIHVSNFNVTYDPQESTAENVQLSLKLGEFPLPTGIWRSAKVQNRRQHPKDIRLADTLDISLQQQASVPGSRVRQVLANATFAGKTVAVFGLHAALQTNLMNQSALSNVNVWAEPAVSEPLNAAAEVSWQVPAVNLMNFKQALSASPNSSIVGSATVNRPSWHKAAVVSLTGTLGRTPQREEYIRESPEAKACLKQMESDQNILPTCQNVTNWANSLDAYELNIRYKHIPVELKRITYGVYSAIRQALYMQLQEEVFLVNPSANTISLGLYINNQSSIFNASVQSPSLNANATLVPLPSWAKPLIVNAGTSLPERVAQQIYPLSYSPSFVWDNDVIVSIDGKSYPRIQSQCWHIALAYTPKWIADAPANEEQVHKYSELRNVVVIRRTKEGVLDSKIKIDNVRIELLGQQHTPTPKIYVNSQMIDVSPEQPTAIGESAVIRMLPNGEVALHFYESHIADIYQASQRIQITPRQSMRESVSGLGGNFNGDSSDDFLTPAGCISSDSEAFQAEWADCKLPHKESKCVYIQHTARTIRGISLIPPTADECSSSESSESQEQPPMDLPILGGLLSSLRLPEIEGHVSSSGLGGQIGSSGAGVHLSLPEFEAHVGNRYPSESKVVYNTDVQYFDNLFCYSIKPIPQCKEGLIQDEGIPLHVDYECWPAGSSPVKGRGVHRSLTLLVPSKCKNP